MSQHYTGWTVTNPAPARAAQSAPDATGEPPSAVYESTPAAAAPEIIPLFVRRPPEAVEQPAAPRGAPAREAAGYRMRAEDGIALIDLLAGLAEYRDPYFRGASSFTRRLACAIARHLGLSDTAIESLSYAAVLRDVGRMALNGMLIPAKAKPGIGERQQIERHVDLGLDMIRGIELPSGTREAIRHHHEQWDGNGYPDALKGEQIPILSRVIHVADSFAAMISARPYRPPKRLEEAVQEIRDGAGRLYDPAVVAALVAVVEKHEYRTSGFGLHEHILIVHGDAPRAARLALELCSRGYLAEVAPDLATARARLPAIPLGAIFIGAGLPDGDGAAFVAQVRATARYAEIPVLGFDLTAAEDRVEMIQAGADVGFPLGVRLDELLGTLGAAIRRSRRTEDQRNARPIELPIPHAGPEGAGDRGAASGVAGLRGNLRDFPLSWLLQTMQYDGRSAIVTIRTDIGRGTIVLRDGILHHAETDWSQGEPAFLDILDWTDGVFQVGSNPPPGPRTIATSMMHLMLEQAARNDEKHAPFGAIATS
jgi:ActR/RegA family two-component response regulator